MQQATATNDFVAEVRENGFSIVRDVLEASEVARLISILDEAGRSAGIERRGGLRNLLEVVPQIAQLGRSAPLRRIVDQILGPNAFAVRGILFDKTPQTNWKVAWHQDLTIAVKERRDVPGFGPWSQKAGVHSVQPPDSILESMITLRLNLDECGFDNGPVRVLPGSHRHGRLTASQIAACRNRGSDVLTIGPRGAALVMRPLLLHASSAASRPGHRRVIHIDYASKNLSGGLEWHSRE